MAEAVLEDPFSLLEEVIVGAGKNKKQEKKKAEAQGRNFAKCDRYHDERRRDRNKLKRILKSNGPEAAHKWADSSGALTILGQIAGGKRDGSGCPSKIATLAKLALKRV